MKLRRATDKDTGPFLAGLVKCTHEPHYCVGLPVRSCAKCHGMGWHLVPLVVDEDAEPEDFGM